MKKIVGILIIFGVFLINIMPVYASSSKQTLGELKSDYNKKLQEQKENNNKTEEAKREIAEKEAAIKQAEADIHEAEEQMQEAQNAIDESNKHIEELKKEMERVMKYFQQVEGGNAYVEYISGASTITDMLMRVATVEQISSSVSSTVNELNEEIKRNEELKIELEQKKKNLEAKAVEYQKIIEQRYGDLKNYDKYALDIDTQVKSLKEKLEKAEKNCKAYAPDLGDDAVISTDCVKKIYDSAGNVVTIDNGEWLKPLTHGIITSKVGYRWGSYHNGLDISGPSPFEGTPVYAAASGVVSGKIYASSCGGNMLFIDVTVNGVPYTTFYYHLLRFNVDLGDVVDQSTLLGWAGGYSTSTAHGGYDTCTTGAHLHFGVAKGFYNGYAIPRDNVITPPGFPNYEGWSFNGRNVWYAG